MKRLVALLKSEAGGAIPLLAAAALALVLANSPFDWALDRLLGTKLTIAFGALGLSKPLLLWINDGLMAVFFLLVGLEIKREVLEGELSRPSQVALPVAGALGGIAVPAAIYATLTWQDPAALKGWAIPSATDIAFSVALLSALGSRVPGPLKLFLLTLAIVDDLAAIVIIATFYTGSLSTLSLVLAGLCILALAALNVGGVRRIGPYLMIGVVLWVCVLESGVHATLAGVVLAFCLPLGAPMAASERPFVSLERALQPWVTFFVLPVFAFANSGLSFSDVGAAIVADRITVGIVLGLFLGKQLGIFAGAASLIVLGLARLPSGVTWRQLYGVGVCGGIGFTMSLFIGTLAFEAPDRLAMVRLGVLFGSLLSACLGYALLHRSGAATAR